MEGFVEYLIEEYNLLEQSLIEDRRMQQHASRLKRRRKLKEQMDEVYEGTDEKYPTYSIALCHPLDVHFSMSKELEKELFSLFNEASIGRFITSFWYLTAYCSNSKYAIPHKNVWTSKQWKDRCGDKTDDNELIREENAKVAYLADCIVITSLADWAMQDLMERGRLLGKKVIVLDIDAD